MPSGHRERDRAPDHHRFLIPRGARGLRVGIPRGSSGAPQMGLSVGIVGLPNVGQVDALQRALVAKADAANYPFCTIEPTSASSPCQTRASRRSTSIVHADRIRPRHDRFRRHRGPRARSPQGARGSGNQVSRAHSGGRRDRFRSPAVSRTRTSCTSRTASIRWRTSRPSRRSCVLKDLRP